MQPINLNEVWLYNQTTQKRNDINQELTNLIKSLFRQQDATFIAIFGRRGTGKTDLGLLIMEILYNAEIIKHFSTNTKIYSSPFPIDEITDLQSLEYWGSSKKGLKVFLFDEIADAMSRRRPMASLTVELIKKFNKLRKHKLSVIATTIGERTLDRAVLDRDLLDARIKRPLFNRQSLNFLKVAYYENLLNYDAIEIRNIPATSVKFDSWDSSPFTQRPIKEKPAFKDKDMQDVYDWTHGKTAKALGLHSMQINRKVKKILKHFFETQRNV